MSAGITAVTVLAEAAERYGEDNVGPQELADTYESMQAIAARKAKGVYYTPDPVARFMARFSLNLGVDRLGPEPEQVMRIIACDPACGTGILLAHAARQLSHAYASRIVGGEPSGDLMLAVMPRVILECVFGMDIDPVAAELARISLSRETAGALTPAMLERHIICGNPLEGASPPAMDDRQGPAAGKAA